MIFNILLPIVMSCVVTDSCEVIDFKTENQDSFFNKVTVSFNIPKELDVETAEKIMNLTSDFSDYAKHYGFDTKDYGYSNDCCDRHITIYSNMPIGSNLGVVFGSSFENIDDKVKGHDGNFEAAEEGINSFFDELSNDNYESDLSDTDIEKIRKNDVGHEELDDKRDCNDYIDD